MPQQIKAIETSYKGYRFRSRLEARWAVFFDKLGIKWEYEKEGFDLPGVGYYLPDFWLPDENIFAEIKGKDPTREEEARTEALANESGCLVFTFTEIPVPNDDLFDEFFIPDIPLEDEDWSMYKSTFKSYPVELPKGYLENMQLNYGNKGILIRCPFCQCNQIFIEHVEQIGEYDKHANSSAQAIMKMSCGKGHSWDLSYGREENWVYMKISNASSLVSNIYLLLARNDKRKLFDAFTAARSARFEHGETPK